MMDRKTAQAAKGCASIIASHLCGFLIYCDGSDDDRAIADQCERLARACLADLATELGFDLMLRLTPEERIARMREHDSAGQRADASRGVDQTIFHHQV